MDRPHICGQFHGKRWNNKRGRDRHWQMDTWFRPLHDRDVNELHYNGMKGRRHAKTIPTTQKGGDGRSIKKQSTVSGDSRETRTTPKQKRERNSGMGKTVRRGK